MAWTDSEINERFPTWDLLSEFWLDGWLDDADCDRIATQLKLSPYTKELLWKICIYEVAPAVSSNLQCIIGEWGAFDPDWLCASITKKSVNSTAYLKPSIWRKYRGLWYGAFIRSSGWNKIVKKL